MCFIKLSKSKSGSGVQLRSDVLYACGFGVLGLISSLALAWFVLANANFLYGVWHDYAGIGAAIDKYGPQNRYKPGFADTTRAQRIALFAQINKEVHGDATGLARISYRTHSSRGQTALLRHPEIIHLIDVARLIDRVAIVAYCCILCWLLLVGRCLLRKRRLPSIGKQFVAVFGLVAFASLLIMVIGPERVFNQFHIWLFPKDHPWFFYYQDSLMSTLMYAPYLFGWIALSLVFLALSFFVIVNSALWWLTQGIIKKRV